MCCAKGNFVQKLLVVGVLLALGTYVFRNTEVGTYTRAMVSQLFTGVGDNIPTKTEIAALEQQINDFEQSVRSKVGPISALKVKIENQEKAITTTETVLAEKNKTFLAALSKVDGDPTLVDIGEPDTRVKELYKASQDLEQVLSHKRQELAADKGTLDIRLKEFQEQNIKLQEFRTALAEIRQQEAQLDYAESTTDPNSPERALVEKIQAKRQLIQNSQKQREYAAELNAQINPSTAVSTTGPNPVTLEEMRNYANDIRTTAKN